MPVIKVWCLPNQTEEELNRLHKAIVKAVVAVPELGLKDQNDMTCLFVPDMMKCGLSEEIIIEIGGLFARPERTQEVLQRLAFSVGSTVSKMYPDAMVECFINLFYPSQGFWTSRDEESDATKRKTAPAVALHTR